MTDFIETTSLNDDTRKYAKAGTSFGSSVRIVSDGKLGRIWIEGKELKGVQSWSASKDIANPVLVTCTFFSSEFECQHVDDITQE